MLHVNVTKLSLLHFRLDLHILAPVPFFKSWQASPLAHRRHWQACQVADCAPFASVTRKTSQVQSERSLPVAAKAVSISVKTQSCRSLDGTIGAIPTCRLIRAASLLARFGKSGFGIQEDCCGLLRPHAPAPSVWARDTSKHSSEVSFSRSETRPETRDPCLPLAGPWRAHTCPPSHGALAPTNGPDTPKRVALQHMPLDLQHPQALNCVCTGVRSQHRPNLPKSIHRLLVDNLQSPSRHMSPEHSEKLGPTSASSLDGCDMLRHAA